MYAHALHPVQHGTAAVPFCSFFVFQYLNVVNRMLHKSLSQHSNFHSLTDVEMLTREKMVFVFMTGRHRFSLLYSCAVLSSALC